MWGDIPCMKKLVRVGRAKGNTCPLCSFDNYTEHYVKYKTLLRQRHSEGVWKQKSAGKGKSIYVRVDFESFGKRDTTDRINSTTEASSNGERFILNAGINRVVKPSKRKSGAIYCAFPGMVGRLPPNRKRKTRKYPREKVAQSLAYVMLFGHELWKVWCNALVKIDLPIL